MSESEEPEAPADAVVSGNAANGGARYGFIESVANERTHAPLYQPNNSSSVLRRRLLHGESLTDQEAVENLPNVKAGLLHAVVAMMEEWGFSFFRQKSPGDNGKLRYSLRNPEHVPVHRQHKPRKTGVKVRKPRSAAADAVYQALLNGEEMTYARAVEIGASTSFFRKLVQRMEAEGYRFSKIGNPTVYRMTKEPKVSGAVERHPQPQAEQPELFEKKNGRSFMEEVQLAAEPPAFLSSLRVVGMSLDESDNSVVIAVKNDQGSWLARVEGYVGS